MVSGRVNNILGVLTRTINLPIARVLRSRDDHSCNIINIISYATLYPTYFSLVRENIPEINFFSLKFIKINLQFRSGSQ